MQLAKDKILDITNDLDFVQNNLLPEVLKNKFKNSEYNNLTLVNSITYPYSTIRIIQFLDGQLNPVTVFIKRITIPKKSLESVKEALIREAKLLELLNKNMKEETVELIQIFPEQQIIATQKVPGEAADSLIDNYGFWWKINSASTTLRNSTATLCGSWLKRYHLTTAQNDQDLTPWYNYLSGEMVWRIRSLKELLPKHCELLDDTLGSFEKKLKHIEKQGCTCTYHGDFAPHNIFYGEGKITVIDFYDAKTGHPTIDLINFIASLAYRAESPLYPESKIREFCDRFLNAYGQTLDKNTDLASLIILLQSIKRLLVLKNNIPTRPDKKLIYHKAINNYIDYLENYSLDKNHAARLGPWSFLDLSTLTLQSNL